MPGTVDTRLRGVMAATRRAAEAVGRFVVDTLERSGPICGMYHCEWIPDGCFPIMVDPTSLADRDVARTPSPTPTDEAVPASQP